LLTFSAHSNEDHQFLLDGTNNRQEKQQTALVSGKYNSHDRFTASPFADRRLSEAGVIERSPVSNSRLSLF